MKVQCHIVKWVEVSDVYEELVGKYEWENDSRLTELRDSLYAEAEGASGAKWEWNYTNENESLLTEVVHESADGQTQEVLCYC